MLIQHPKKTWLHPDTATRKYTRMLVNIVREMRDEIVRRLKENNLLKLDASEDDFSDQLKELFAALMTFLLMRRQRIYFILIFFDVNKFNDTQFRDVVKSMGITLPVSKSLPAQNPFTISAFEDVKKAFGEVSDYQRYEDWLKLVEKNWLAQNELLVKSLLDNQLNAIEQIVRRGVINKTPIFDIVQQIDVYSANAEKRAVLIARDQVNKLNAQLTQHRQQALNQTQYRWITCRDERVRGDPDGLYPNAIPSHFARDNQIFEWDHPPEGGHPGQAINCRCRAELIVP